MNNSFLALDPSKIREYTTNLREKDEKELRLVISRYIEYLPEMCEAALIVAVDKGFISYALKEKLSRQIMTNIESHQKGTGYNAWKSDNAFREFVAGYTDDELYNFIDQPSDIVIDVYTAILDVARERELISDTDSKNLAEDVRLQSRTEDQVRMDDYREMTREIIGDDPEEMTPEEIEEEKKKYWVCPNCHELVEMDLGICWNCQSAQDGEIKHPETAEVIREIEDRKPFSFTRTGITLIVLGGILLGLGILHKSMPGRHFHWFRWDGIIIGGLALIFGFFFLIRGAGKSDK